MIRHRVVDAESADLVPQTQINAYDVWLRCDLDLIVSMLHIGERVDGGSVPDPTIETQYLFPAIVNENWMTSCAIMWHLVARAVGMWPQTTVVRLKLRAAKQLR